MQDPKDPGTLCLVEACKRPLTGAERQKRRREKLKQLREAGQLFALQVTADELDAIRASLCYYADRNHTYRACGFGELENSLWRRFTAVRVGKYYDGDPVWSREALQAEAERVRQLLVEAPEERPNPDDLAMALLPARDRVLLQWARRNEQLIAETPPEQAYPADPERRNLLGQALNEKHELNGRYQVLLDQAAELSQLIQAAGLKPRLSNPAMLLREYRQHSECYKIKRATEGGQ